MFYIVVGCYVLDNCYYGLTKYYVKYFGLYILVYIQYFAIYPCFVALYLLLNVMHFL